MKNSKSYKKIAITALMFVLCSGLIISCGDNNKKNNNDDMMSDSSQTSMNQGGMNDQGSMSSMDNDSTYEVTLKGSNEVPSNNSSATGDITVTVMNDSVHVEGDFSDLSSNYTASHIHMAAKGQNGKVIQPLDPDINSDKKSGSFDESYAMDSSQMNALKNGKLYINVHSKKHPKGEIRAQITHSGSMSSDSDMDDSGGY